MQLTEELLVSEINRLEAERKNAEQAYHRFDGALTFAKDTLAFMRRVPAKKTDISPENAAIQEEFERQQNVAAEPAAMTVQQFAEAVAGPGATAEVVENEDASR